MSITTIDEGLICREYRQAADKNKQVGILADLNDCKKEVILEILSRHGEITGLPAKKKNRRCIKHSRSKACIQQQGFQVDTGGGCRGIKVIKGRFETQRDCRENGHNGAGNLFKAKVFI